MANKTTLLGKPSLSIDTSGFVGQYFSVVGSIPESGFSAQPEIKHSISISEK